MSKIDKTLLKKKKKAKKLSSKVDYIPATYDAQGRARKTDRKLPNYKRKPNKTKVKNKKELAQLTAEWYDYLAHKGFEDIEWFDPKTGKGQNSSYLKGGLTSVSMNDEIGLKFYGSKEWVAAERLRYRCISNFLAHTTKNKLIPLARTFRSTTPSQLRFCLEKYSEGATYREIAEALKTKATYWKPHSYFWVFTRLKPVLELVEKWNREDPEGLLNPSQTELYLKD